MAPSWGHGKGQQINFDGEVHPAFLDVAEDFRRLFRRPGSGGGALAVRLRGESVLDVWAGTRDLTGEHDWEHDTMALSFSTTKGVTSTVIHRLVDRGLLDTTAPVAAYWDDFAAGGKGAVTVRQLLSHRAGLHDVGRLLDEPTDVLDHQRMEKLLAAARPSVRPGRRPGYHGFTFGWLASGLARAVTGKDMRQLFVEEVAEPLGLDGCTLGVDPGDDATEERIAPLHDEGLSLAALLGSPLKRLPGVRRVSEALHVDRFDQLLVEPPYPALHAQMPAVNGCFTARSLATMYAALAAGGIVGGQQWLSPAVVNRAGRVVTRDRDYVLGMPMRWRLGYHQAFTAGASSPTAFGHYGYGGSGAWGDPASQLAVGFVTNRLGSGTTPIADSRLLRLNRRIQHAAERYGCRFVGRRRVVARSSTARTGTPGSDPPSQGRTVRRMERDAVRGWVAVALVALAATIAQAFGRFTYSVLLPAVRDDLGLSNSLAGFLGTVNVAAYLLGTVLVIRATANLRLVTLLRIGLALAVVGLAGASVAPGGPTLAAALVVLGLGGACIWIPSPALAASAVPDERRGVAVGLIGAGIGLGIVSAGQLATVLRDRLGDQAWQDVYRIEAVVGLVAGVAIVALLRPTDDPAPSRSGSGFAVLRSMDGWRALLVAYSAFGLSYLLVLTYLTARLEDDAGYSEAAASSVFAATGLAGIFGGVALGWLTDRLGPRRVLVLGFLGIAAAGLAILTGIVPVVYAGAFLLGMMFSGVPSVIAVYIVQHSDATTYGPRYAVATLAFGVAQVSAPQLGGFIADVTGAFTLVFLLSAGTAVLGAVASWQLPRAPQPSRPAQVAGP